MDTTSILVALIAAIVAGPAAVVTWRKYSTDTGHAENLALAEQTRADTEREVAFSDRFEARLKITEDRLSECEQARAALTEQLETVRRATDDKVHRLDIEIAQLKGELKGYIGGSNGGG